MKNGKKLQQNRRDREMKPAKETEKAETDRIKKMKLSFFTINGDTPITLSALNEILFSRPIEPRLLISYNK